MSERIRVRAGRMDGRVVLWERDPAHPQGEAFVSGDGLVVELTCTPRVEALLRDGHLIAVVEEQPAMVSPALSPPAGELPIPVPPTGETPSDGETPEGESSEGGAPAVDNASLVVETPIVVETPVVVAPPTAAPAPSKPKGAKGTKGTKEPKAQP